VALNPVIILLTIQIGLRSRHANWSIWLSKYDTFVCSHRSLNPTSSSLATDTEYVRSRLAEYGNDLLSLGVDGLRLDAAKRNFSTSGPLFETHQVYFLDMAATDLANITSRFISTPYLTQEVIWGAGEPIQPSEYLGIGMSE